ncbi:MAG: hypothetical protein ACQEXJ_17075 [Myxococcota bacterium]
MHRNATIARALLLPAVAALLVAGCDSSDGGGSPQALDLNIYTSPTAANPYQDVAFMVLKVMGPDLGSGVVEIVPYEPGGSGTVPDVPFGTTDRQVVAEAWAGTPQGELSHVVSRGRSVSTQVSSSVLQPRQLPLLLARVNSFLPLTDAVDSQAQSLEQGRVGHTTTRTPSGEVLIAGGATVTDGNAWWRPEGFEQVISEVEVVEERSALRQTHSGGLPFPRAFHTATALSNGDVIFAGGWDAAGEPRREAAWYAKSKDGSVSHLGAKLSTARAGHTATLVEPETFEILFVGGDAEGTWELWNPSEGRVAGGPLPDGPRRFHSATWFEVPGEAGGPSRPAVLIVGGEDDEGTLASSMVYDVKSRTMLDQPGGLTRTVPCPEPDDEEPCRMEAPRTMLTGTWVPAQSKIYLVGGFSSVDRAAASNTIDVYETTDQAFRTDVDAFNLAHARGGHTATLMDESSVLIAGGAASDGSARSSIEIIHQYYKEVTNPSTGQLELEARISVAFACEEDCPDIPDLPAARFGHAAVALDTGMVLLAGGLTGGGATALSHVLDLTLYNPR